MSIQRFDKQTKSFQSINYTIPEIQRERVAGVVDIIYKHEDDFYRLHGHYILPGTISIVKCCGVEYVVDGQHRMSAYNKLSLAYPERVLNICIDYYECKSITDMEDIYKQVNTSTPNDISKMSIDFYKIKKEITTFFKDHFQSYIKNSSKPIAPNISLDTLHNKIDTVDLSIFALDEVTDLLLELNKFYANCQPEQFARWHVDTKHIHNIKQRATQLYLGLYREHEYIDRVVELKKIRNGNNASNDVNGCLATFADIEHYNYGYRPKITKTLRRAVWNSKQTEQLCYCCEDTIQVDDFHCGHVIALIHGGLTNKDNLRPVCSNCNNDMGTMDLEQYKCLLNLQV